MKKVFTNGCFDVLHVQHIRLLEFAKNCGDYLVVGINSDESVKRLKGHNRPINYEQHRKEVLESIRWVDDVIIFYSTTPIDLIHNIKPDIIVKGADWKGKHVVGSEIAKVKYFPYIEGFSSSRIISKQNRQLKTYCFDIDETICKTLSGRYEDCFPDVPMIKHINRLYEQGNTIKFYTARGKSSGVDYTMLTLNQLKAWKVKYHDLSFDKPSADIYIDDKAVNVRDYETD